MAAAAASTLVFAFSLTVRHVELDETREQLFNYDDLWNQKERTEQRDWRKVKTWAIETGKRGLFTLSTSGILEVSRILPQPVKNEPECNIIGSHGGELEEKGHKTHLSGPPH